MDLLWNKIMTQLEKNLQKSLRTSVSIYHDNICVANVYVRPDTYENMLNEAYMLSQSINKAWYIGNYVDLHVNYARSSRLTDKFRIDDITYTSENVSSDSEVKWRAVDV